MTNKDFVLKIIRYIGVGFLIFMVFGLSFYAGIYYSEHNYSLTPNTQSLQPTDTSTADYTFTSSNFPMLIYEGITGSSYGHLDYFPCVFTLNHSYFNVTYYTYYNGSLSITLGQNNPLTYNTNVRFDYNNGTQNGSFEYFMSSDFDCNPIRFSVGLLDSYFGDTSCYESYILFVDSSNNTFQLGWRVPKSWSNPNGTYSVVRGRYGFGTRTYFLSNSLSDNEAYNAGLDVGRQEGLSDNQQSIYDAGFDAGEAQGDSNGYQRGLHEANQYTFLNLAGAVVDAPIKASMGLLNFNFLGFNLWNLATGILTFAVVVKIVKLVLGGR